MYTYICIQTHTHTHKLIHTNVCTHVRIYTCTYIHTYTHTYMPLDVYRIWSAMYIYTYIHTYAHTFIPLNVYRKWSTITSNGEATKRRSFAFASAEQLHSRIVASCNWQFDCSRSESTLLIARWRQGGVCVCVRERICERWQFVRDARLPLEGDSSWELCVCVRENFLWETRVHEVDSLYVMADRHVRVTGRHGCVWERERIFCERWQFVRDDISLRESDTGSSGLCLYVRERIFWDSSRVIGRQGCVYFVRDASSWETTLRHLRVVVVRQGCVCVCERIFCERWQLVSHDNSVMTLEIVHVRVIVRESSW